MSIKLRAIPSFRARMLGTQAPNTAALSATFVPAVAFTAQIAAFQRGDTMAGTLQHVAPGWPVPDITLTVASPTANLSSFFPTLPAGETFQSLTLNAASAALPAGVTIDNSIPGYRFNMTSPSVVVSGMILDLNTTVASGGSGNWATRIADPGVVWYHSFESAAEVNQFRWVLGPGNDPGALSTNGPNCAYIPTGGADGGGYLRIRQLAGQNAAPLWLRPFSPLTGATNGRGVGNDDPGANGTIARQAWVATQGQDSTGSWAKTAKPGWWGAPSEANSFFDSGTATKFYIQLRVKTDPMRTFQSAFYGRYIGGGKNHVFTTTNDTSVAQTQVVLQAFPGNTPTIGPGSPNYHNGYSHTGTVTSGSNPPWRNVAVGMPGSTQIQWQSDLATLGVCDPYQNSVNGCWTYRTDGTWDTLLYEITPAAGASGGTGHIKCWAAHQGETSYTKIWDFDLPINYEQGVNGVGSPYRNGYNCLWLAAYNNMDPSGSSASDFPQFDMSFDQVIFSKNFIVCPS